MNDINLPPVETLRQILQLLGDPPEAVDGIDELPEAHQQLIIAARIVGRIQIQLLTAIREHQPTDDQRRDILVEGVKAITGGDHNSARSLASFYTSTARDLIIDISAAGVPEDSPANAISHLSYAMQWLLYGWQQAQNSPGIALDHGPPYRPLPSQPLSKTADEIGNALDKLRNLHGPHETTSDT